MLVATRLAMISGLPFELHNGDSTCLVADWSSRVAILNIHYPGKVIDPKKMIEDMAWLNGLTGTAAEGLHFLQLKPKDASGHQIIQVKASSGNDPFSGDSYSRPETPDDAILFDKHSNHSDLGTFPTVLAHFKGPGSFFR